MYKIEVRFIKMKNRKERDKRRKTLSATMIVENEFIKDLEFRKVICELFSEKIIPEYKKRYKKL